jgi:hypothetical protein
MCDCGGGGVRQKICDVSGLREPARISRTHIDLKITRDFVSAIVAQRDAAATRSLARQHPHH